jgi:hypothetical protein
MIPPEELRHLDVGSRPGERASGTGTVSVVAHCHGDAGLVGERAREVMRAVLAHVGPPWPSSDEWRQVLPQWFVEGSAPEQSREEAERWLGWWRSLSAEEQARVTRAQRWTLADWLYWLDPSERQWFWWDAVVEKGDRLRVIIEVSGWPAPLGALDWLLRAAGAVGVTHDEPART